MPHYLAIAFAFAALFAWGFSEFYIQKTSRIIGVWKVLFSVGVVGFVTIFPFIKNEFAILELRDLGLLTLLSLAIFLASLFNFEALKKGKLAIVEPLIGMELPLTMALSMSIGKERLTLVQLFLIAIIFVGLLMVITMHHKHLHQTRRTAEKGVMLAIGAALGLAMTNFLVGVSSRQISPLFVVWLAHSLVAIISAAYLLYTKKFHTMLVDLRSHLRNTLGQSLLYNFGWVAFALATTSVATSIVTAISESYIILGVILGIFINHEKLKRYQIIGIILSAGGIIALSMFIA